MELDQIELIADGEAAEIALDTFNNFCVIIFEMRRVVLMSVGVIELFNQSFLLYKSDLTLL